MTALLTILHISVCLILILTVLLQSGKAGDLAGAFGGAGSQSVFGPRGAASILSKLTTISAVLFMVTSMGLWILSSKGSTRSVVRGDESQTAETVTVPATKTEGEEIKPPAEVKQEAQVKEKAAPPKAEKKK